ncbi:MAG: hypothetical protein JXA42_15070, partial [Anaerolineales bacterium]|nr:hypothetical protein [Anaerolineales bacterium]
GLAPEAWALIMLVAGTSIAAAMSITRGDVAYLLVIIWAFIGIAIKHTETPVVATTAWTMTVITFIALVVGIFLRRRGNPSPASTG